MNPASRGVRNAFRNNIRTISIVIILGASIGLALSMLIANKAVTARMDDLRKNLGNTLLVRPAGSMDFQGGGEPLKITDADKLKNINHVASVQKTSTMMAQKDTGDGGESKMQIGGMGGPMTPIKTNLESAVDAGTLGKRFKQNSFSMGEGDMPPPMPFRVAGIEGNKNADGTSIKLTEGRQLQAGDTNQAVVGKSLAEKNKLKLGSTFTLEDKTFTVVGVYDAGTEFDNNGVKIPFATAVNMSEQKDEVSTIVVQVDNLENVEAVKKEIQSTLGSSKADVSAADPTAQSAIDNLKKVEGISAVGFVASLAAAGSVIFMTMLMIVRERRREIGVLKAIGAKTHKIVIQFMVEASTLAALALVVGFALAMLMSNGILGTLVSANASTPNADMKGPMMAVGPGVDSAKEMIGTLQATIGWETILLGVAAALLVAIVGSAVPAWFISKIRPNEVMRAE